MTTVTAKDIDVAAGVLAKVATKTPLQKSERLSEEVGRPVYLKREDLQICRSFKVRGAYVRMAAMDEDERAAGVVCASAGNHAQGVAYACAHLGIQGTIFLPASTPRQKRKRISTIGGKWVEPVIVAGDFDEANRVAAAAAKDGGKVYVHPYDDPGTIAGGGTIGVELAEQIPADTSCVLVPVGGGGLIAGIATALSHLRPDVRVIGVEPYGAASMQRAFDEGGPTALDRVDSFVDGTAVGTVGTLPFQLAQENVSSLVSVPEGAVCTEMVSLYQTDGIIAEPAGALASTAARTLLTDPKRRAELTGSDEGSIVCVVSGGNNDLSRYAEVVERSLRHEGLRHYFVVTFPQQPGALRLFLSEVLGPGDDVVHFEYTKKNNRETGPALVGIDLSDPADIERLRTRMEASPLHVEEVAPDSEIFRLLV